MRLLFLLLCNTFCFVSLGQNCISYRNDTINCWDTNGQKQGVWRYYDTTLVWESNTIGDLGCIYKAHYAYNLIAEGNYQQNIKTGTWTYYDVTGTRLVTYLNDGSTIDSNLTKDYCIYLNSDSSTLVGNALIDNEKIKLLCKDGSCQFQMNPDFVLLQFPYTSYTDFSYYLLRLTEGMYTREIRFKVRVQTLN